MTDLETYWTLNKFTRWFERLASINHLEDSWLISMYKERAGTRNEVPSVWHTSQKLQGRIHTVPGIAEMNYERRECIKFVNCFHHIVSPTPDIQFVARFHF